MIHRDKLQLKVTLLYLFNLYSQFSFFSQGLEGEDDGAISMMSDNTAKLTSAVRYVHSVLPLLSK